MSRTVVYLINPYICITSRAGPCPNALSLSRYDFCHAERPSAPARKEGRSKMQSNSKALLGPSESFCHFGIAHLEPLEHQAAGEKPRASFAGWGGKSCHVLLFKEFRPRNGNRDPGNIPVSSG